MARLCTRRVKGATHAILAHNHPSGVLTPSKEDIDVTDRLCQCGLILDIPIKDHLIVTMKKYFGFKEQNIMREISRSIKYVPPYKLKEQWLQEGEEIKKKALEEGKKMGMVLGVTKGRIEGESNKTIEIVKNMIADNEDILKIIKYTGLNEKEIEKIKIEIESKK